MIQLLESEVENLSKSVAALKTEASNMRQQLAELYTLTGHAMAAAAPADTEINKDQTDST